VISVRTGWRALAQSRRTVPGVSSPASVVRSIVVMARSSQAACHSRLTVRRATIVAARRSTALRLTRTSRIQPRSSGIPGLRLISVFALTTRRVPISIVSTIMLPLHRFPVPGGGYDHPS